MTPISATAQSTFRAVFSANQIRAASPADALCGVQPQFLLEPATEEQLATALRLADESKLAVIPSGGGTKLGWGNAASRADLMLSTRRLNRILEHAWADLTVTVEAGCTIETLQQTLARHGQRLALDPLWPGKATVGGILSTNDSGALRLRFGALRDLIIGVTIALADGTLASSGGKVVKNVAGYDLPKLVTGAFGTLGVITRAVFRLHPLPRLSRSFAISASNPEEAQKIVLAIQDSELAPVALQSHFSAETSPVIDILFEGTEAGLDAQANQLGALCRSARSSLAQVHSEPRSASNPNARSCSSPWNARQDLWSFSNPAENAIAKVSALPADLARSTELIRHAAESSRANWRLLVYATGLGWLRVAGPADALNRALTLLRADFEKMGGSLAVLHRPPNMQTFDAWGLSGDSLPLMRAVKSRLDPSGTLNPGRFVAGI
ncbi:MAG TPA: FAD-binding oxidoreductase [Candidatus Acidoferrum sp.]|jgi:glycolate oxidase FAD binding subunit|nr:FAD-binding oxidoreductase [Candidatus Acidoferrum sp.]